MLRYYMINCTNKITERNQKPTKAHGVKEDGHHCHLALLAILGTWKELTFSQE
jgi:hypothetical protein